MITALIDLSFPPALFHGQHKLGAPFGFSVLFLRYSKNIKEKTNVNTVTPVETSGKFSSSFLRRVIFCLIFPFLLLPFFSPKVEVWATRTNLGTSPIITYPEKKRLEKPLSVFPTFGTFDFFSVFFFRQRPNSVGRRGGADPRGDRDRGGEGGRVSRQQSFPLGGNGGPGPGRDTRRRPPLSI